MSSAGSGTWAAPQEGAERRIHIHGIREDAGRGATLAEILRNTRSDLGKDLDAASHATKIKIEHLQSLESGAYERLPGKTYAIGYIRSYASFLGLSPEALVGLYKKETVGLNETQEMVFPDAPTESRLPHGTSIIFLVLLLIGGIAGGYHFTVNSKPANGQEASSEGVITLQGADKPLPIIDSPDADKAKAVPVIPAASAVVPAIGKRSDESEAATAGKKRTVPGLAAALIGENAETTLSAGQSDDVQASPIELPDMRAAKNETPSATPGIILKAHDTTWIQVSDGFGTVLAERVLTAGDLYKAPNQEGLTLTAQNGAAVEILVNGESVGLAGRAGQSMTDIALDPELLRHRVASD